MRSSFALLALSLLVPLQVPASVADDLLAFVPADATSIGGIDVARARSSSFGQFMLSRMDADDSNYQQFVKETGFDPRQDLLDVLFASADAEGRSPVTVARGSFDIQRIEAHARSQGAAVQKIGGVDVLVVGKNKDFSLAFPLPGIAVMGFLPDVRRVLDPAGASTGPNPELARDARQIAADHDAWFISTSGAPVIARHMALQSDAGARSAKAFESVRRSSGGIRFGDQIQVTFDALARSPADATSLADVVRMLTSFVQMERQNDGRAAVLAGCFDNMDLRSSGDHMHLAFSLTEQQLEQIAELGPPNHPTHRR